MSLASVTWRPPRLETERLVLRGLEPSDQMGVYAFASDPEVAQYMSWEQESSPDEAANFLDEWVAANYRRQIPDYAICLKERPEELIGACGLYWDTQPRKVLQLGYVLQKRAWGRGYMPEAGKRLIRYGFESMGAMRIFAPVFVENAKSRRAAEKMGMRFEGVVRSAMPAHGRRWDEAYYSILPGEMNA